MLHPPLGLVLVVVPMPTTATGIVAPSPRSPSSDNKRTAPNTAVRNEQNAQAAQSLAAQTMAEVVCLKYEELTNPSADLLEQIEKVCPSNTNNNQFTHT